jgi:hypothetical protein
VGRVYENQAYVNFGPVADEQQLLPDIPNH